MKSLVTLITILIFVSCGKESGLVTVNKRLIAHGDKAPRETAVTCKSDYYLGSKINFNNQTALRTRLEGAVAAKKYNPYLLNVTLKASMDSINDYLNNDLNLKLYRSNNKYAGYGCANNKGEAYLTPLTLMSGDYKDHWDKVWTKMKGGLFGLYLPKDHEFESFTSKEDAIIVYPYSTKWTVIHEMMHHLFHIERKKQVQGSGETLNLSKTQVEFKVVEKSFKDAIKDKDYDQAAQFVDSYYKNLKILLKAFPLEEVAIEKILVTKYLDSELSGVESSDPVDALNYANSSLTNVNSILKAFMDNVSAIIKSHKALTDEKLKSLNKVLKEVKKFKDMAHNEYIWLHDAYNKVVGQSDGEEKVQARLKKRSHGRHGSHFIMKPLPLFIP